MESLISTVYENTTTNRGPFLQRLLLHLGALGITIVYMLVFGYDRSAAFFALPQAIGAFVVSLTLVNYLLFEGQKAVNFGRFMRGAGIFLGIQFLTTIVPFMPIIALVVYILDGSKTCAEMAAEMRGSSQNWRGIHCICLAATTFCIGYYYLGFLYALGCSLLSSALIFGRSNTIAAALQPKPTTTS